MIEPPSPVHATAGVDHDFIYRQAYEAGERAGYERARREIAEAAAWMEAELRQAGGDRDV